jgi:hypothetical protein
MHEAEVGLCFVCLETVIYIRCVVRNENNMFSDAFLRDAWE